MKPSHPEWEIGHISAEITRIASEAANLLDSQGDKDAAKEVMGVLCEQKEDPPIKVAFIGQYNAGKSSIISALTGRSDIKVSSNIATDRATSYDWNGILLTDTPGLYTEHSEHDAITREAIKQSDLLVYVITSSLFDVVTVLDFKNMVFGNQYKPKMMLVINKMSSEEGEYEALKKNYLESMQEALGTSTLEGLRMAFIDARDYLENPSDDDMIALSHMNDLINELNEFCEARGLLGRLDQPLRVIFGAVQNAEALAGAPPSDVKFLGVLDRIERRVEKSLRQSANRVEAASNDIRARLVSLGSGIAGKIGVPDEDVEGALKAANSKVNEIVEEANEVLAQQLEQDRATLDTEMQQFINSDTAQAYFQDVKSVSEAHVHDVRAPNRSNVERNYRNLERVVETISPRLLEGFGKAAGQMIMKAADVAGSPAHQAVYNVGKFFGVNFKPWQAVNIAGKIGRALQMLGPLLAIIDAVLSVKSILDEEKAARQLDQARNECRSSFIDLAVDIEAQFRKQFEAYKHEYYDRVLEQISASREQVIQNQNARSDYQKRLHTLADQCRGIVKEIESH